MQSALLVLCSLGIIGFVALIRASYKAPEGMEDELGFHFLDSSAAERYEYSPRVALSEGEVLFFK